MKNNLFRSFCSLLCCCLLFFSIAKPLTAKANVAQATIDIGYTLQDVFAVDPALVPFALTLLAAGYVFSNTDELIEKAQELSQQVRPTTEIWAKKFAENIEAGVETTWRLTSAVIADVNSIFNNFWNDDEYIPLDVTHIISPACLTELSSLTYSELLLSDMVGILSESATTTNRISSTLTTIKSAILSLPETLSNSFEISINSLKSNLAGWESTLNQNFQRWFGQTTEWLQTISQNMNAKFGTIANWCSTINTTVKDKFGTVSSWLKDINTSISVGVISSLNALKSEIISLPVTIADSISAVFFPNGNHNLDDEDLNSAIDSAFNTYFPYFGSMKDYLADYSAAFLASGLIFNQFADIPFFNSLLLVSVSIGVIGAFLALGLNAAQSDKSAQRSSRAPIRS